MKAGRCIAGLAAALLALLFVPTTSTAVDSDLKFAYAFKVKASNGFEIVALASNERADGRGEILLIVSRHDEGATYLAPAHLTATSLTADLGVLGKVNLAIAPSGRKKQVRSQCEGPGTFAYEPPRFLGTFEFHGEEGYTEVTSAAPTEYTAVFDDLSCGIHLEGESFGPGTPGARLGVREKGGDVRLRLRVRKNAPQKRSFFEVQTHEKRGKVQMSRTTAGWMGSGAFRFDPELKTATVAPAAPFAGEAIFHRGAAPANRWKGDLTVDLPGYPNMSLTGDHPRVILIHSCWSQDGDSGC